MQSIDFIVLGVYFGLLIVIGFICSLGIRKQEDFFMGGRGFGRLLQTFAAFGAGTGAQDPINLGRTTWTSGLSGIWSALNWLFVTPFYWIFAVWYRRMRHLTLGDWFVERYQSKPLGVAYTVFAFSFQMLYLSIMFSAISKVVEPLLGNEAILQIVGLVGSSNPDDLRFVLIPLIAGVVLLYGVLGGLTAAYWTDLLQGICIIALSVILIPTGLAELVRRYGADYPELGMNVDSPSMMDGMRIMHDRLQPEFFQLFNTPLSGEFPPHYIIMFAIMSLIGIVVQPHFIATGGGSARTEEAARMGLVTGNFLKRLCTIGWGFTGLIALALLANSLELNSDPDRVWGVASREILQPLGMGLVGLMLACLMAALMSSADCYMLVSSALLVRNVFAAYIDPEASEKTYIAVGRVAGLLVIVGASFVAMSSYDVFKQYQLALELAATFAAPFWIGMFWRRGTTWAAWLTIGYLLVVFYVVPMAGPAVAARFGVDLQNDPRLAVVTDKVETVEERTATPVDVERREIERRQWLEAKAELDGAADEMRTLLSGIPDLSAVEQSGAGATEADTAAADTEAADTEAADAVGEADSASDLLNEEGVSESVGGVIDEIGDDSLARLASVSQRLKAARERLDGLGAEPQPLALGDTYEYRYPTRGGTTVFWAEGELSAAGWQTLDAVAGEKAGREVRRQEYVGEVTGKGRLQVEFLPYLLAGVDLSRCDRATLETLRIPVKVFSPFLVMWLLSWVTPRCRREGLDRYFVKMKTPVDPDPRRDEENLRLSYANPSRFDHKKLLPWSQWEFQRPRLSDVVGFVVCVAVCFLFLWIIVWVASLGA